MAFPDLVAAETKNGVSKQDAEKKSEEEVMAILLLEAANTKKYDELRVSLYNNMLQNDHRYPTTKVEAYSMFSKYVPSNVGDMHGTPGNNPRVGINFYQKCTPVDDPPVPGVDNTCNPQ